MRLRNRLRILSAICLLLSSAAFGQADSLVVQIPTTAPANTSMITAPEGFVASTDFNGYLHPKLGGSIVMTMIENVSASAMDDAWEQDSVRTFISRDVMTSANGYEVFMYKEETNADVVGKNESIKIFQYTVFIGTSDRVLWLSISHVAQVDDLLIKGILSTVMNADLTPGS